MATRRTDWQGIVKIVNTLVPKLRRKPRSLKIGYSASPGGILNAYREGDLTFKQAVKELERWHRRKIKQEK